MPNRKCPSSPPNAARRRLRRRARCPGPRNRGPPGTTRWCAAHRPAVSALSSCSACSVVNDASFSAPPMYTVARHPVGQQVRAVGAVGHQAAAVERRRRRDAVRKSARHHQRNPPAHAVAAHAESVRRPPRGERPDSRRTRVASLVILSWVRLPIMENNLLRSRCPRTRWPCRTGPSRRCGSTRPAATPRSRSRPAWRPSARRCRARPPASGNMTTPGQGPGPSGVNR